MNQELLDKIANELHDSSFNYTVFLRKYEAPLGETANSVALIRSALGTQAELGGIDEVVGEVGWQEVEEALLYDGGEGAGPSSSILESDHFLGLIDRLQQEFFDLVHQSKRVERFWLQDGHPSYPVFWDFAFLFWTKKTAIVFIGSSSD